MSMLEVKNLNKKYNNIQVIKDISFKVEEGETFVILGASGSGKSTILRCINGLEKIDYGNIIINGENMILEYNNDKPVYNKKEVLDRINLYTGMIFQDFNLFPHLSVKDNIIVPLVHVLKLNRLDAEKVAYKMLSNMGLENKANEYPCNLSGGQKQRVSIARCLALNPKIICMDEPTSALDPQLVGEVLKVIKKLREEKRTMIIVTHEIEFAQEVADKVIFMDKGVIVEEGTPEEVIVNPSNIRTKEFLKRYIDMNSSKENKNNPKIQKVLDFFEDISKIPRKSGDEKKIKDYLVQFAQKRGLDVYEDENYNVIIKKKASPGYENRETIALQAHTDMICEKVEGSMHDFNNDAIDLINDGKYIRAKETTLGADNGIGMAQILAILNSKEIKTPNIEAIFTSQEETTMIGAKEIDLSILDSNKIISLDGGKEGKILVSSANCLEWKSIIEKEFVSIPENYIGYTLNYSDFKGGHSGGNIGDKERGNPIKLGIEAISKIDDVYIKSIFGGSRVNVIPRDFSVKFYTKQENIEKIKTIIEEQKNIYKEANIEIVELEGSYEKDVYTKEVSNRIIGFISDYENGVINSDDKNILLSCNMAAINEDEKNINIEYSTRANDIALRDTYLEKLDELVKKYKLNIVWSQELKGVTQDINNSLITKCNEVYNKIYGKDLDKVISQGVVEGGFFSDKIKNLEYVCIGPNIEDAHSPNERLEIASLERTWEYLKRLIKELE